MLWYKSIIITYHTDSPVTVPALRNLEKYSSIFLAWSISLFFWQSGELQVPGALFLSRAMEQLPNATPSTSSQERHDTVIPFKGLLDRRLHIQFLNIGNLVRLMSVTACQLASYFRTFRWDFHCKIGAVICLSRFNCRWCNDKIGNKGGLVIHERLLAIEPRACMIFFRDDYRTIQYNPTKSNDCWFFFAKWHQNASNG